MEDQKNNEKKGEEDKPTTEDTGDGDNSSILEATEAANKAAERLETANAEQAKVNAEARTRGLMGGLAEAGKPNEAKEEESPKEYVDRLMKTGKP